MRKPVGSLLALALSAALAMGVLSPASAEPGDVPDAAPPAATKQEPRIPAADGWPFSDRHFPRTSGTGRLHGGASYWSDFVYDDHGASNPLGLTQPGNSNLAPTQGAYTYPEGPARNNGADIFRTAVGLDEEASFWRVDWSTLVDPDVPIAAWTFDRDSDPATGVSEWPAFANATSPGIDTGLVVSSRGAWLVDLATDRWRRAGRVTVDEAARSFVVRIPRTVLPVDGRWTVRLASGLADDTGQDFAQPQTAPGVPVLPTMTRIYNVTFRGVRQEPPVFRSGRSDALIAALQARAESTPGLDRVGADGLARFITGNFWMEDHQADSLASNDVSEFSRTVDWTRLARDASTPEPRPRGYSNRWYVSGLHLGQGVLDGSGGNDLRPNFVGRIQPYAVYVPRDEGRKEPRDASSREPMPLTWVLHSLGVNHNQYGALNPRLLQQLCEDRDSVCASTLGHGPDGWYLDEAEADYWSVWRELAQRFPLQPRGTVIGGYSMGGYAAYKLGLQHPDLYAGAVSLAGPPACGSGIDPDQGAPIYDHVRCNRDGATGPLVGNARWLPYRIGQGTADQLVPFVAVEQQVQKFDKQGLRHRFVRYPGEDHMLFATQDRFSTVVEGLGRPKAPRNPGRIDFTWYPHLDRPALGLKATGAYWVTGVRAHDRGPGALANVTARSFAIPDRRHDVVRTGPTPVVDPLPAVVTALGWRLGARPDPRKVVTLRLRNVAATAVDLARAGLECGRVRVRTDRPVVLRLTNLADGTRRVSLDAGRHVVRIPC